MDKMLRKLEEMSAEERSKFKQILKEKGEGKDKDNVEWMYKKDKPDEEEYLLGRRIDQHIEKDEEPDKDAPGALFKDAVARRADLDMHAKMREDPLYAIRKKEEDAKRRLLENPIRMKQLQQMIDKKEKHKKKKKKEKKKKHRKHHSSDESSDSDDELVQKYLAILNAKKSKTVSEPKREDSSDSDSNSHSKHKKHKRDRSRERSKGDHHKRRQHSSSPEKQKYPQGYGLIKPGGSHSPPAIDRQDKKRSKSPKHKSRKNRSRSRSPKRRSRSKSPKRKRSRTPPPKRKLTEAEKEAKRREMMENASERDKQRESNVKRYKEDDEREERVTKAQQKHRSRDGSFLNPLLSQHAESSSVEDRIKRNKYNIQRTKASMDGNFMKKH